MISKIQIHEIKIFNKYVERGIGTGASPATTISLTVILPVIKEIE